MTAVQPGGRFGVLDINNLNNINSFVEKAKEDGGWINGGFMVLEPEVLEYIKNDETIFEKDPLEKLATFLASCKHLSTVAFGNAWILNATNFY